MNSQPTSRNLGPCLVCDAPAVGINFAAATCAPCKAFFRRNAVKFGRVDFVCQSDGHCPIICDFRRLCNCCRLAKCFRVGMQKTLILTKAKREARNELVKQNREKRAQIANKQKPDLIRPSTICRLSNEGSRDLFLSDQALLTNIYGAYEQTYRLSNNGEYSCFPRVEHLSVHTFYIEYEERHKRFIDYCKFIPEFQRLSIDDKKHLLQNHLVETVIVNNEITLRSISQKLITSLRNVYGIALSKDLLYAVERLSVYIWDPVLLKLVLIIQTLSSGINRYRNDTETDRVYDNPLEIFAGQNVYVELLWRYVLSRLPSERDAVKFFNKLIRDLFHLQYASFSVECYISTLGREIEQMGPLMQSLWNTPDK